jgi:hypothetical protein
MTPCFNYRTANNISYCAPASLCTILEPCNNVTRGCSSNTSVCVINSCCTPAAVCLPLIWTELCPSINDTNSSISELIYEGALVYVYIISATQSSTVDYVATLTSHATSTLQTSSGK